MKNILTVWDGKKWSLGALDLSCHLASLTQANLTGIFCDTPVDGGFADNYIVRNPILSLLQSGEEPQAMDDAIAELQKVCGQKSVDAIIQKESGPPNSTVLHATLFADVLIADQAYAYLDQSHLTPSSFINSLLIDARCPVIIAPGSFAGIEEIIFAYDGSYSSVFAMKQITYLFPEFKDIRATVVQVSNSGVMEDYDQLNAWLRCNYSNVSYEVVKGHTADSLFEFAMVRTQSLLVMGAYGRSAISKFFKASTADSIIKYTTIPVFITHH